MRQSTLRFPLLLIFTWVLQISYANVASDTCNVNDICELAIEIPVLPTDEGFVCIPGCTNGVVGGLGTYCLFETYPTVWYSVETDASAHYLNVQLRSDDMLTPAISVYESVTDCSDRLPVSICHQGTYGELDILGISVAPSTTYFIAVSALYSDTGDFELCINSLSTTNECTIKRSIAVVDRSAGGALTGPFLPGETVRVCMQVDSFTAARNGCQWFQGIVPSFGNGWSPESFNSLGQPLHATINDSIMGLPGNGLYPSSGLFPRTTWDWFTDVDYHWKESFYKLGDFDGNDVWELCNARFDAYCESDSSLSKAACCRPCWDDTTGTILPGGWFAYGINGSCALPAPPIHHDWGDGISCGGGMGPWRFCFDLQVGDVADCDSAAAKNDLSLSFFTFADGEIGSWTGSASICALDQPATTRLPLLCAPIKRLDDEVLENLCEGKSLNYMLFHPDAIHWTWSASPTDAIRAVSVEGDNGHFIFDEYDIDVDTPVLVTYTFLGQQAGTDTLLIKNVSFYIIPQISIDLPAVIYVCKKEKRPVVIRPVITGGDRATMDFTWTPFPGDADTLVLYPPFEAGVVSVVVSDEAGCFNVGSVQINLRPCLGGADPPTDDNDPPTPQDSLPRGRYFMEHELALALRSYEVLDFTIKPVPAEDEIVITTTRDLLGDDKMIISDLHGVPVLEVNAYQFVARKATITVMDWPAGMYIATLHTRQEMKSHRIIKM